MGKRKWTEEAIVAVVREVGQRHGGWIPAARWEAEGYHPTPQTIIAVCGSWLRPWELAGYAVPQRWTRRRGKGKTDAEMLADMRRAHESIGDGCLSEDAYTVWHETTGQGYCASSYRIRFGSWENARGLAGLRGCRVVATPEAVLSFAAALWERLGHFPIYREWDAQRDKPCAHHSIAGIIGGPARSLRGRVLAASSLRVAGEPRSARLQALVAAPEAKLTAKEREVAEMARLGYTLQEIGDHFGVTRESVRQTAKLALERIAQGETPRSERPPRAYRWRRGWTEEEILDVMARHYARFGSVPTKQAWDAAKEPFCARTITLRVGPWREAWDRAIRSERVAAAKARLDASDGDDLGGDLLARRAASL